MAEAEMACEVVCRGRKRELDEENEDAINNYDDDDDDSEESDYSIGCDFDDPSFEILGGKSDSKIWKQYYKEWKESEGFDISVHPGTSFMAGLVQLTDYRRDPEIKQEYTLLCQSAIHDFNSKNDELYAFEEIVNVNATFAAGIWYYFTFNARDTTTPAAVDAVKTFQALVWHGIDKIIDVEFCRLKKFISNEDKKEKKKKKKCQQDSKAVTEVGQDKPSLLTNRMKGKISKEQREAAKELEKRIHMIKAFAGFKVTWMSKRCFSHERCASESIQVRFTTH